MLSVGSDYYWRVIDVSSYEPYLKSPNPVQQDEPDNLLSAIERLGDKLSRPTRDYIKALQMLFKDLVSFVILMLGHRIIYQSEDALHDPLFGHIVNVGEEAAPRRPAAPR